MLIINNLNFHERRNKKVGIIIVSTVMFIVFVRSFSQQITTLSLFEIGSFVGTQTDFSVIAMGSFNDYKKSR